MARRPKSTATNKPPKASIELLASALQRFEGSSRYPMLEHLTVSAFASKESKLPKSLSGKTFGDFVRDGAAAVCSGRGISANHIGRIIEILGSLLDGENTTEQPHIPSAPLPKPTRPRSASQPPARVSSVEAEIKLTQALSRLRMSPQFRSIARNRLGDYWNPGWVRAPFEEALTLEQLSQLKPQALLEKRSFTTQKLLHLVAAVDRALSEEKHSPETPLEVSSSWEPTRAHQPAVKPTPGISFEHWKRDAAALPAAVGAAVILYEHETDGWYSTGGGEPKILREIPSRVNAREYITVALLEEYEPSVVSSMLKTDYGTVIESSKIAYRKIEQGIREIDPGIYQALTMLLSQPASPLTALSDVLFGKALSDSFRASLTAVIARSLGGNPVEAFGLRPAGFWSKNPQGLERAVRLLVAGLPKSDSELKAEAHTILPGLPFETVAECLRSLAFFNDKALSWARRTSA